MTTPRNNQEDSMYDTILELRRIECCWPQLTGDRGGVDDGAGIARRPRRRYRRSVDT